MKMPLHSGFLLASLDFNESFGMVVIFIMLCTEYVMKLRGRKAMPVSRKNAVLSQKESLWQEGSMVVLQEEKYQFKYCFLLS